jgi:hypothetical protein
MEESKDKQIGSSIDLIKATRQNSEKDLNMSRKIDKR